MNSGKRKMKEVVGRASAEQQPPAENHQFELFGNVQGGSRHHSAPPSNPPAGCRQSQVRQILNSAAARPSKPFSFTSLLVANDEDDVDPLTAEIQSQSEQVNQIILLHTDILRQALGGVLEKQHRAIHRAADERAQQKLKQKEVELQIKSAQNIELARKAEHYRKEVEHLRAMVEHLEQATTNLKAHWHGDKAHEDTNSSTNVDSDNGLRPVRIDCWACSRQRATVMMLPCRHVCVCSMCEGTARTCPVCRTLKRTSLEVIFPVD
ncbi:SBP (S-ribonuclease binding protein) family protein [Striga asiatica]|uniref:SBP (S-ribonuclease binding protein) family protein n=1 Tax=Striga asiatica TaxID=4170 RepID=A0A5A7R398_STRAF|nr:SBP (S-ribonuclease binding protein) family protein [Striga asiatica]